MQVVEELLELSGIGKARMALRWVSAAEGQLFATTVTELTESAKQMGAFDRAAQQLPLAAIEGALKAPRMRWLTGMDRHLTERGNVYQEKLDPETFHEMVKQVAIDEYQKALLLETLKQGPLSVREMAAQTGLPVYTVSLKLNDLERRGLADLKGYEGTTPKFVSLAA